MSSPAGTATDVGARVQLEPARDAAQRRIADILSVIGGGLVIAAYFLPWSVGARVPGPGGPPGSDNVVVFTGWDNISRVAFGYSYVNGQSGPITSPGSLPYGFLAAAPMLMAAIVIALGGLAVFWRPGALRTGLYAAAGGLMALSSFGILYSSASLGYYGYSAQLPGQPLLGLGPAVFYIGLFVVITGGVSTALSRRL